MSLQLTPIGTLTAFTGSSWRIGGGPFGARSVSELPSVVWESEKVSARSRWANGTYRSGPEIAEVHVRAMLETEDGALLFLDYLGRFRTREIAAGGHVLMTGRFETADERYAWLNATQLIGKGTLSADRMTYEVYVLE